MRSDRAGQTPETQRLHNIARAMRSPTGQVGAEVPGRRGAARTVCRFASGATGVCSAVPTARSPLVLSGSPASLPSRSTGERAWGWGPGSEVPLAPPPGPHLCSHGDGTGVRSAISVRCDPSWSAASPAERGRGDESPRRLPITPPSSLESGRPDRLGVGQFGSKQNNASTTGGRRVRRLRSALRPHVGKRGIRSSSSVCRPPRRTTRTVAPARKSSMAKKNEFPATSCRGSRWRSEVFL